MSDKTFTKADKAMQDLITAIEAARQVNPSAAQSVFSEVVRSVESAISRKSLYPDLFDGVKPRPSREEQMIRSAEINLQKQKDMLADLKKRKQYSLANPGRAEVVEHEAIERQVERVARAERQLAKAKGEHQAYSDSRKEAIRAKREAEKQEFEQGIVNWQAGWRSWGNSGK